MIRLATPKDRSVVIDMSLEFWHQSPYRALPYDIRKVEALADEFLGAKREDKIIVIAGEAEGILAAHTQEILFSQDKIAAEILWWVSPEARGSRDAFRMLDAFEYWSTYVAKAKFSQLCMLEGMGREETIRKVYERRGFTLMENGFLKKNNYASN